LSEFDRFRGWLKALYPHAKTIKGLPQVQLKLNEAREYQENAIFNRTLRQLTEFVLNQNTIPPIGLVTRLIEAVNDERLLSVAFRVLRNVRRIGMSPNDALNANFVTRAIEIFLDPDRGLNGLTEFSRFMEKCFRSGPNNALIMGCEAYENLLLAMNRRVDGYSSLDLAARQEIYFGMLNIVKRYAPTRMIAGSNPLGLLNLLGTLERAGSPLSGEIEFIIPTLSVPFSQFASELLWKVAEQQNARGSVFVGKRIHATLCEAYLSKGKEIPEWLLKKRTSKAPEYLKIYAKLNDYLKTGVAPSSDMTVASQARLNSQGTITLHKMLERAIEFAKSYKTKPIKNE
jgi:hypothetical protein